MFQNFQLCWIGGGLKYYSKDSELVSLSRFCSQIFDVNQKSWSFKDEESYLANG